MMMLVELLRMLTRTDSYYWRLLRIRKWISVLHQRHNIIVRCSSFCVLRSRTIQDDKMTSPCCIGSSGLQDFDFHYRRVTFIIPVPVPFPTLLILIPIFIQFSNKIPVPPMKIPAFHDS